MAEEELQNNCMLPVQRRTQSHPSWRVQFLRQFEESGTIAYNPGSGKA